MATSSRAAEFGLSSQQLDELVKDSVVWANQHGLVVALNSKEASVPELAVVHAPLSALPVSFPRERFLQAKAVMPLFNELVDAVARDERYLEATLESAARFDEFTARLLALLRSSRAARLSRGSKDLVLGVHRSDYMLDAPSGGFLQVELNTIASSFGCLSSLITSLHRYTVGRGLGVAPSDLPDNPAIDQIPAGIAAAAAASDKPGGVVVMVVQPGERNAYDQQWIQLRLWEAHGLRTLRMTLADIATHATVSPDGTLMVPSAPPSSSSPLPPPPAPHPPPPPLPRYSPTDYPSEVEWKGRDVIESSDAAKCPSVAYQLAGSKKIQQALALPGALERFLPAPGAAAQLSAFFAGLWGLDDLQDPGTAAIVSQAIADPDSYVLKPQREGGGNNMYGDELVAALQAGEGLSAYILMQKIRPPPVSGVLVRNGLWEEGEVLSELGIYGVFLRQGQHVMLNTEAGHLVRTKRSDSNEGGVAAGFAVLDSPLLV
ncbi:MAG: hypothetical protein WDW38_004612 [Sanguina aurantia]